MKRSEMLDLIYNELLEQETKAQYGLLTRDVAEIVLSFVEKQGMLPPPRGKMWESIHDELNPTWEPENE